MEEWRYQRILELSSFILQAAEEDKNEKERASRVSIENTMAFTIYLYK